MTNRRDPIHSHPRDLSRLLEIMRRLRDPETGCPWDIEQDFASIAPYTIEEAYEVADAIARDDMADLRGELGDLLFQAVYHGQLAQEAGHFSFDDIVNTVSDKMIARHPHVFGHESRNKSADQQSRDWETQKAKERGGRGALEGVAMGLPGLTRAVKLQNRAARVGFDWPQTTHVLEKLTEEASELVAARETLSDAAIVDEMGDLLFVVANLARHLNVDPEAALRGCNDKFERRFSHIETSLAARGKHCTEVSLEEMDALWDEAKTLE